MLRTVFLALLTLITACSSEGLLLGGGVAVRPSSADFGRVRVGAFGVVALTVENTSDEAVALRVARTTGDDTIVVLDPDLTVAANATEEIEIAFEPTRVGPARATITFSTSGRTLASVEAVGEGIPALCPPTIAPELLSFGNVVVGSRASRSVVVDNCDVEPISIHIARTANVRDCILSRDPTSFCVDDPEETITIPPDSSAALDVSFVPAGASGREGGELVIAYCDQRECETSIRLEGRAVERGLVCSPAALDFPDTSPGSCSTAQLHCENVATDAVTIVGWRLAEFEGRPSDGAFTPPPSSTIPLPPGTDVDIDVTFCPTRPGEARGLLAVETDHPDPSLRRHDTPLVGYGGGPELDVTPETCVDFGIAAIGVPVRRQVVLSSVGDAPVEILAIDVDVAQTGAFASTDAGAGELAPGAARVVTIEMSATREGPIESSLRVASSDPDQPVITRCLRGEGMRLDPCAFELFPSALDFGNAPLMRTHTRGLELRNIGTDACLLNEALVAVGSDPTFSIDSPPSRLVPAGASIVVDVAYTPLAAGDHEGTVVLALSNPTTPFVEVPIAGHAREGAWVLAPPEVTFGAVDEGCTTPSRSIRVWNRTNAPIVVDEVTSEAGLDFAVSPPSTPATLASGASLSFEVTYQPRANGQHAGAIRIRGTDADGPLVRDVSLFGERAPGAVQVDEFLDVGHGPVDVLIALDTSASMSDERDGMAQNMSAFFAYANEHAIDYQVGVVTVAPSDQGRLVHPVGANAFGGPLAHRIITRSSLPSPADRLEVAFGIAGFDATEQGMHASLLALSGATLAGHNAGFLRPDASLAAIYMADEPEQSPLSLGLYSDFLWSLKPGHRERVSASAMTADVPPCTTAVPAPDSQAQLADRTGGTVQPLCGPNWDATLYAVGTRAFGVGASYPLRAVPDASTIELYVDGVLVPPGSPFAMRNYDYVPADRRIEVTSAAPIVPGSNVALRYTVACQ